MNANVAMHALRDRLERILIAGGPLYDPESEFTLPCCQELLNALSKASAGYPSSHLAPQDVLSLIVSCEKELTSIEEVIDQSGGWGKRRLVPTEFSRDELTLRALHDGIERYQESLEPEYGYLPAHILTRMQRQLRLLAAWDVLDSDYQPGLRSAIRGVERAFIAAESAPRN